MVPARNLQLLRDAHATPAFIAALTAHPHHHMAQEPIDQAPPKPLPPPQQQEVPQDQEERRQAVLPPPQQHLQPAAGTSGSSSGGSSSNGGGGGAGDWLRLGLGPASPSPGAAAPEIDLFLAPAPRHGHDVRDSMGMPPGAFARPGVPGIPQASIQMPVPRAGPPWMPPWSPAAAQQPSLQLLPFGHRGFYGPGSPAASSSGFETIRVVLPPPAATAAAPGVWFVLQAAPHQEREPFLPQIPRSYLRIKDARVTVRLLIKYLVNKLRLEDESEVEITCRARPLLPFMTLQHVRDTIWCQRDAVSPSVSADMSTADHIMVLQYGRRP